MDTILAIIGGLIIVAAYLGIVVIFNWVLALIIGFILGIIGINIPVQHIFIILFVLSLFSYGANNAKS